MTVERRSSRTADLAEAEALFRTAYPGGGLRLSESGDDFSYAQQWAGTATVGVVRQHIGARLDSRSDESDLLTLAWATEGENRCWAGTREVSTRAGLLWSGTRPIEGTIQHADIEAVVIDRGEFERRAALLLRRDRFTATEFSELPSPRHVALARTMAAALRERHLTDLVMGNELTARTVVDHVVAVILAAAGMEGPSSERVPSAVVRRALQYIDDNLHHPIGVIDVAAACGLSVSGLTHAFRRELGQAPARRIRDARLAHTRRDLLDADPVTATVAAIARRWGFRHLGRFAADYAAAFGEAPSATLRR